MRSSGETDLTISRMRNYKNILGILAVLGIIIIFVLVLWGPDTFVWVAALFTAIIFFYLAGQFLKDWDTRRINSLQYTFYAFVILWILGMFATWAYWDEITASTAIGIVLSLIASYLMNQFITDARKIAVTTPSMQVRPTHPPPMQPSTGATRFCVNCGAALDSSAPSKFCAKCGAKIS